MSLFKNNSKKDPKYMSSSKVGGGLYQDCAILVCSCDKYVDAWEPFFRLLHTQWPECPFDIYFNSETLVYECDFMEVKTICGGSGITWSKRLKNAIKKLNYKYVFIFLEDFFLISPVLEEITFSALNIMDTDKKVGVVSFNPDIKKALGYWELGEPYTDEFVVLKKSSQYRVNAQANIWNRRFLLSLLRNRESPWEFEVYGTLRAKRSKKTFLCRPLEAPTVLDYHTYQGYGYGLNLGKWLPKNKELFDRHGIVVDFDRLGWWNADDHKPSNRKKRTKLELMQLCFTNPFEIIKIVYTKISQKMRILIGYL